MLHENIKKLMEGFQHDAHPMGHLPEHRRRDVRLSIPTPRTSSTRGRGCARRIGSSPRCRASQRGRTATASAVRYIYPDNDLSFTANFLNMLFKMTELKYQPNPVFSKAL